MKKRAITLREARQRFFATYGFSEAGYDDPWFRVELGPIPVWLPNVKGRARAVATHDLHHVLTGYEATLVGEGEIGAWELATGCGDLYAAWAYNLLAVATGTLLAPRRVARAFLRGRRSTNLYGRNVDDALLDTDLAIVRHRLGL